jgi:hypothetical protein
VNRGSKDRSPTSAIVAKAIFYTMVVICNIPVIMVHLFYRGCFPIGFIDKLGVQPLLLNFVGNVQISHRLTLLLNDIIVIGLETCVILHQQFLQIPEL